MKVPVNFSQPKGWEHELAFRLTKSILQVCKQRGSCNVLLTGGRSAERLYKVWAASSPFALIRNVHFYFGDERCVSPDDPLSNFGLAMRTLFLQGVPKDCTVTGMASDQLNYSEAAAAYAMQLPNRVDLLLLSVGLDGHIASIFPHSTALKEKDRRVVAVRGVNPQCDRLTITPPVIHSAHNVIVMALGAEKRAVYEEAKIDPADVDILPARLVLGRTWILGE